MTFSNIVITGASSGIGAALADRYAAPGVTLGLVGRDTGRLGAVAAAAQSKGANCTTAVTDVRDRATLAQFLTALGEGPGIDLFIANAGIIEGRGADDVVESGETARRVLEINLLAAVDAIHLVLPAMRQRRRGQIAIVSSLAGFSPLPDAPAYSASKAGLISYGLALREAVASEGVGVTVICPGYVTTPMGSIHIGKRPFEIPAAAAAERIAKAIARNADLAAFPMPISLASRFSLLMPEWIRRAGMRGLRFHVVKPRP